MTNKPATPVPADVHLRYDEATGRIVAYVHDPAAPLVSVSYRADGSLTLDQILSAFGVTEDGGV
jgi:hypothetical protein